MTAHERRGVAMIALGDRPWSAITAELFRNYAKLCGAEFFLIQRLATDLAEQLPRLPDRPGRANKLAYGAKALIPWWLLTAHALDKVLIVDDSCCVIPSAPDIFTFVDPGECGFTGTSHDHARICFDVIKEFLDRSDEPAIPFLPDHYMNSGVMVYTKEMASALHPDRINKAATLLFSPYPHQTLTYYLLKSGDVPMRTMPKAFNRLPAASLPASAWRDMHDVLPYVSDDDDTFIYHVTGAFRRRDLILPSLALHLLQQTDPARAEQLRGQLVPPAARRRAPALIERARRLATRLLS